MSKYGLAATLAAGFALTAAAADLRLGIVGTDTSHATEFTKTLNDPSSADHVAGARIVVAFKGGSADVDESRNRVEKFAAELRDQRGIRFVDRIADMCGSVDGFLLESVDGRKHLEQLKELLPCGKPVFIDKPLSATYEDALAIAKAAKAARVPWFSASSLRYSDIVSLTAKPVKGAIVWAPGPIEPHQPMELSWYGIHGVEMLFTLLGPGCRSVTRTTSPDADVVTGVWSDGRLGTVRLSRPYSTYGAAAFRTEQTVDSIPAVKFYYRRLVEQIVQFIGTGKTPVPNDETLEIMAFLDAAQRSKEQGGAPVEVRKALP